MLSLLVLDQIGDLLLGHVGEVIAGIFGGAVVAFLTGIFRYMRGRQRAGHRLPRLALGRPRDGPCRTRGEELPVEDLEHEAHPRRVAGGVARRHRRRRRRGPLEA